MNAQFHTAESEEKSNHSFLITHLVLECLPNMKVTYLLNTSECTSSHSSKWRKEQSFILSHTSSVRMLYKYESNLPPEHKIMHKFTQQQVEKRTFLITQLVRMLTKYESNLPSKHKRLHKFTQ